MSPLLEIRSLRKAYRDRQLLDIESLVIHSSCAYVLTGANGAGKSTFLRILAGLETADIGAALFAGEPVRMAPYPRAMRESVVYVHQHPVMFSTSVAGNIGYGLAARGMPKAEIVRQVDAAMAWAGVAHLRNSDPASLSGGEKQRVALARAKILSPKLLLLDEPTSNLDGAAREQMIALIPTLTEAGSSVIMACHDRDLIALPGVQRMKLRDGRLQMRQRRVQMRVI